MRSRSPRRHEQASGPRRPWLQYSFIALVVIMAIGTGTACSMFYSGWKSVQALGKLSIDQNASSEIYDINGALITKLHGEENRTPVKLSQMPQHLKDAMVAVEDSRFFHHKGIDIRGITRAIISTVTGRRVEGGSTITQQLARNAFPIGFKRTLKRKVEEMIIALQLERKYTKEEILELYLNQVNFGFNSRGVQAAAQLYFGKDVWELNLAESALIAGLVQSPNYLSPYASVERAVQRQHLVLGQMVRNGYITEAQAEEAKATELKFTGIPKTPAEYLGASFVDYVIEKLLDPNKPGRKYTADELYTGGLKIYTTLDLGAQRAAESAIASTLDKDYPLTKTDKDGKVQELEQPEAAAVVMNPNNGYITAMVGGRRHKAMRELNRAWQTVRQPGSAMKPLAVYVPAIDLGYTTATVIDDAPFMEVAKPGSNEMTTWPENYEGRFYGLTPLRRALETSRNVVAARLLQAIGPDTGYRYAEMLGITTLVPSGTANDKTLSLGLGGVTKGVKVLDMAVAYGVLASGGFRSEPMAILKVEDRDGQVLEEFKPQRQIVLKEETAYVINDMLKGVLTAEGGTGGRAYFGRPAAGKTGTTSDWRDAWFAGYTPNYVGVVWMGYDNEPGSKPKPLRRPDGRYVTGGSYPATIWNLMMSKIHEKVPVSDFPMPKNIVTGIPVCKRSGLLPSEFCPPHEIREEIFIAGTEPTTVDTAYGYVTVCAEAPNKLYSATCGCTPMRRLAVRRPEPWKPAPDGRIPADAGDDWPTETCSLLDVVQPSGNSTPPPGSGDDAGGVDAGDGSTGGN